LWIIDHQLDRRNISLYSRGRLINRKRSELSKGQGYRSDVHDQQPHHNCGEVHDDPKDKWTDRKLAKESGISHNTLSRIAKIEEKATPEQKKALEKNEISINEVFTNISKEEKREARQEKLQEMEFPEGKYRVIYADPPWDYGSSPTAKNTADPELHYPVMPLGDICGMPIKDIADDNAVLFLWTTSYHIFQAQAVLESWGFTYKSMFIWDKVKHNMGRYNSVRHEILLIATKGSCIPDNVELFDSVQSIKRKEHSEKPGEFRKIIETLYKHGNKLELFARKKTEGWEVYGNEVGLHA
jgi:N6-adenosine-specific RNA methylase IME4